MCLALPGRVLTIDGNDPLFRQGRVSFGGVIKRVNLSLVPEANPDDYVIVHAGFAISCLDQAEAAETLRLWQTVAATAAGRDPDLRAPATGHTSPTVPTQS